MTFHPFAALLIIVPAVAQSPTEVIVESQRQAADQAFRQAERYRILEQNGIVPAGAAANLIAVKNAPYSADAITETTQTLSDGNRIEQRTTQKLYRDADGRERREESVLAVGALTQPDAPRVITISDPVANVTYTLDPRQNTARRGVYDPAASVINALNSAIQAMRTTRKEDLGSKNIEGVVAQGTRTTYTIPAGQIGNLLPINVVDEVWYSPELHMNVLTTHTDPRSGETVYKLINISRANPPTSMFELPPGYAITGRGGRGPAPLPAGTPAGRGGSRGPAPTN